MSCLVEYPTKDNVARGDLDSSNNELDVECTDEYTDVLASPPKKRRRCHYACCMYGASCDGRDGPWTRVPPPQTVLPSDGVKSLQTKGRKAFLRNEYLRRAGITPQSKLAKRKDLRICSAHPFVELRDNYRYETLELDGDGARKTKTKADDFLVPDSSGLKKRAVTTNRGLVVERFQAKILSQVEETSWMAATQQCSHLSDTSAPDLRQLNETVRQAAGLDVHVQAGNKRKYGQTTVPLPEPQVHPENISDDEVKIRTGFRSLLLLLAYILIVCNGSVEAMTEKATNLTWFEEWMIYFEWIWGRECLTLESLANKFSTSHWRVVLILERKRKRVLEALHQWPRFVSFEEDFALRSQRWKDKYRQKRVIFWDDTNVAAPDPSDADLNRAWYSYYYGTCVAKGAVFLQLCGWMGGWEPWSGAISDTDYQQRAGVFEYLQKFVAKCPTYAHIAFLNIVDKGYRCTLAAWRAGRQLMLQPDFARSDQRFNSREVLRSGAVASDRSSNERGVNVMKRSALIRRGLGKHQDPASLADAWLAWGFQVNFMYKPVL